jgi:hypothetical protein
LSNAPFQPSSWLRRVSSSYRREWVKGQLGAFGDGAKPDLDERLAGILHPTGPAPAHRQALGSHDLEIFAAAFVLAAVEHAEANPVAAADARVGLGQ